MGTRSTYRIMERGKSQGKIVTDKLVLVYVQYDGYPEGHPADTAAWLASGKVVNGLSSGQPEIVFNGAGCLAAQLIARLKTKNNEITAGGTYIYPMSSRGNCGEDYMYDIIVDFDTKEIEFVAYGNYTKRPKKLFKGSPANYPEWVKKFKEE